MRLAHRRDIHRARRITNALLDELEQQADADTVALLEQLGENMRNPDENGIDRLNDLYHKVISLPERSKTMKTLSESLRMLVDMERTAFGMDDKEKDEPAPGSAGYVPPAIQIVHVKAPVHAPDEDEQE